MRASGIPMTSLEYPVLFLPHLELVKNLQNLTNLQN